MYLVCVPTAAFSSTAHFPLSLYLCPQLTAATLSASSALFIYFASPANRQRSQRRSRLRMQLIFSLSLYLLFANALW